MAYRYKRTAAHSAEQKVRTQKNKERKIERLKNPKKPTPLQIKKAEERKVKRLAKREIARQRYLARRRVKKTVDKNY